ncbi:MAG: hypothetical protein JJ974_09455 [Phycisphaerales bacterium]|nr:hypothetical protein [Phycisphaerales bacterium]
MTYTKHANSTPSSFRSKLGAYMTGLAIGFFLLGMFMLQKSRSEARLAEAEAVQQLESQQTPATDGTRP